MVFTQVKDLFLDVTGAQYPARFFASRENTAGASPLFVEGDAVLLRLWLCSPPETLGGLAPLHLRSGGLVAAIKAAPGAEDVLALSGAFTFVAVTPDGLEGYYRAVLDLGGEELHAAVGGRVISARLDIELQGANPDDPDSGANALRLTFASDIQIVPEGYTGDEPSLPALPAQYPPAGDVLTRAEAETFRADAIAAAVAALPAVLGPLVGAAVEAAADTIPRITTVEAVTLPAGSAAAAALDTPDAEAPAALRLTLGLPRGANGDVDAVPPTFFAGKITLQAGATSASVEYPVAFAAAPVVTASIERGASGDAVFVTELRNCSAAGFAAGLSAAVPAGETRVLHYIAVGGAA
jgi:hypothetical protein